MMMGLRLNVGVSDRLFRQRFGAGIAESFPVAVSGCLEDGLLEWAGDRLRLTDFGRPLGNEAFGRFIAEALD
jgi:coproporphyrinogen III oxidase-like Fe-S oxidoreductase